MSGVAVAAAVSKVGMIMEQEVAVLALTDTSELMTARVFPVCSVMKIRWRDVQEEGKSAGREGGEIRYGGGRYLG